MSSTKRSLWPMGIIGALLIFAIFIVSVAIYISKKKVDIESLDYYSESVLYEEIIEMKNNYKNLDEKPIISVNQQNKVFIKFPNSYWSQIDSGKVTFYKPDDASLDFETIFKKPQASSLTFNLDHKKAGIWKAKFRFSILGKKFYNESQITLN